MDRDIEKYRVRTKLVEPSGTRSDRPGLLAMLNDGAQDQFDIILAWRECKWSVKPVGIDILDELKRKAKRLNKEGEIPNLHYALFARTGFTSALENRAKEEGVLLFTLEDIGQSVLK